MNADTHMQLFFFGKPHICCAEMLLNLYRTARRRDRASKLGHDTVAGNAEGTAMMLTCKAFDKFAAYFEAIDCALLISGHEEAEAPHIRGQNRNESPLIVRRLH